MIQYTKALDIITSEAVVADTEKVDLKDANNRVLAEDVKFDINIPPFDKSAMDGYACRKKDLNNELTIIETINAGKQPEKKLNKNECAKIMTGAVIPEGSDCVFMKEHAEELGDNKVKCTNLNTNLNICYKAEDVKIGDLALGKSTLIFPKHIPVLASAGIHQPSVYCQPKVSVFATGTELVEPDAKPLSYQIRNSNSSQMLAQLSEMGITGNYLGIIKDTQEETETKIKNALDVSDIIIMSGGVSVGEFDFIPQTLEKLRFEIILRESAIQPGRPIIFAKRDNKYCFGFAGNPVSSYIQFQLYLKPFIYRMMNYEYKAIVSQATLMQDYKRKKASRLKFIPGTLGTNNEVSQVEYNGSAHIHALVEANCVIEIPLGVYEIKKGETVNVRQI